MDLSDNHCNSRNTSSASDQIDSTCSSLTGSGGIIGATALRFIVRDMGNGVDRIEDCAVIRVGQDDAAVLDGCLVERPCPARILDLRSDALAALGIEDDGAGPDDLVVVARAVDDRSVEITSWRRSD